MASPNVALRATVVGGTPQVPAVEWKVGAIVTVKPRTWAGINRPGGHGRVSAVHLDESTGQVSKVDVTYVLGGSDKLVDLHYVELYVEDLDAGIGRRQRRATTKEKEEPSSQNEKLNEAPAKKKKRINNDENAPNAASASKKKEPKKGMKRADTMRILAGGDGDNQKTVRPPVKRKLGGGDVSVPVTTPDVPQVIFLDNTFPSPSPMACSSSTKMGGGNTPQTAAYMLPESTRRRLKRVKEQPQPPASTTPRKMPSPQQASTIASPFKYRAVPMPAVPGTPLSAAKKKGPQMTTPGGTKSREKKRVKYPSVAATNSTPRPKVALSPLLATLQSEHGRVMNDAAQFIKEVVVSHKSSPDQQTEPPSPEPTTKIDPDLLAKFHRALQELWDNCDGEGVDEEGLANEINQYCSEGDPFEDHQVQELLDHLCQQNKVMRGDDGQLYVI